MPSLRTLAAVVLTSLVLAGCSGGGKDPPVDPTEDLGLKATETTGVIRGVVVDQAIAPIAGVAIVLRGADAAEQSSLTTDTGAFGFDGLAPGSYFVSASKAGFGPIQQNVEVEAGVADPPIVKIQLVADASSQPTFEVFEFHGYLECSVIAGTPFTGGFFQPCEVPGVGKVGNDNSYTSFNISGNASFIHVSMVWEPTQAFGQNLYFNVLDNYGQYNVPVFNGGPSPLTGDANATAIADSEINEQGSFTFEVAVDGEAGFAGASYHQMFDAYIVVFHGFEPPEGYAFWRDGPPTVPS